MDPTIAERMTEEITGKSVGGWSVGSFLGAGKSALVFECARDDTIAALKVFDPDLVNRYGKDTQLERIRRELSLVGKRHPNLVQIYDGGECPDTGYLFVVMELIPGSNLEDKLADVPRDRIPPIMSQVTSAAMYLEQLDMAHRDIKPSNIAITDDFQRAVLMDLGVLRPFGESDLTDQDAKVFVGTLRYSSPEFLYRADVGTKECWKAVSIYQLGGVLHDLIMRKQLFHDLSDPFSLLVDAVKSQRPNIYATDVSQEWVDLARNSLTKDPEARLRLVSWDDFLVTDESNRDSSEAIRARVMKRQLASRLQATGEGDRSQEANILTHKIKHLAETIENAVHNQCAGDDSFPRMSITSNDSHPVVLRVEFCPSDIHLLSHTMVAYFKCEIVDEDSFSICVDASSFLIPTSTGVEHPAYEHDVFRGRISSPSLARGISDYLYQVIDAAQSVFGMEITEPYDLGSSSMGRDE